MNANDTLLVEMIKQDMQSKGISDHYLVDELVENPQQIKVGANEAVYVYYFSTRQKDVFKLELVSGTTKVVYTEKNTRFYLWGKVVVSGTPFNHFESSLISRHWSNVKVSFTGDPISFFLRYVKVKFTSGNEKG